MDVVLLSEDDDDAMLDVPFERIHTPTRTVRSSTNTSTDSPGSKLKKIRVEEEAKINEEVDTYLYHLSKVDVQSIKCVSNIQKLLSALGNGCRCAHNQLQVRESFRLVA